MWHWWWRWWAIHSKYCIQWNQELKNLKAFLIFLFLQGHLWLNFCLLIYLNFPSNIYFKVPLYSIRVKIDQFALHSEYMNHGIFLHWSHLLHGYLPHPPTHSMAHLLRIYWLTICTKLLAFALQLLLHILHILLLLCPRWISATHYVPSIICIRSFTDPAHDSQIFCIINWPFVGAFRRLCCWSI